MLRRPVNAGEAIFLARHQGLPTRLLDWTANALYALYFACIEKRDVDGAVWALVRRSGTEKSDIDPFEIAQQKDEDALIKFLSTSRGKRSRQIIKIIYPFYDSPRILAQDGAFTVYSDPWTALEAYEGNPFEHENLDIQILYRWRVPAKRKPIIVKELSGLGITHRLLFPDLDGIARSLWETEVLWNGEQVTSRSRSAEGVIGLGGQA